MAGKIPVFRAGERGIHRGMWVGKLALQKKSVAIPVIRIGDRCKNPGYVNYVSVNLRDKHYRRWTNNQNVFLNSAYMDNTESGRPRLTQVRSAKDELGNLAIVAFLEERCIENLDTFNGTILALGGHGKAIVLVRESEPFRLAGVRYIYEHGELRVG